MVVAKILLTLVCLQLISTMTQAQRTIKVYNFATITYVRSTELTEAAPYAIELPSRQAFGFSRLTSERLNGFVITNFDSAVVLKLRFIDNFSFESKSSMWDNDYLYFDTTIVLHPDSILYNNMELVKKQGRGKFWIEPQNATNNSKMWKRHNRIRWILAYDTKAKWAMVKKCRPMLNRITNYFARSR
jgi:hypothetical protein